jgi:putative phosphoribosyl transferase
MTIARFRDRTEAGRELAAEIARLVPEQPVVYALPRGGVPIGLEIATVLGAPLDLLLVRKIGVPWNPELAAGSVVDGERPDLILNDDVIRMFGVTRQEIEDTAKSELREIERRRALYLPGRNPVSASGHSAILVDDGIATGASMRAAIAAIKRRNPLRIIVGAPVASPDTLSELRTMVDQVVVLIAPARFRGVGEFYQDFHQLEDGEVIAALAKASAGETRAEQHGTA